METVSDCTAWVLQSGGRAGRAGGWGVGSNKEKSSPGVLSGCTLGVYASGCNLISGCTLGVLSNLGVYSRGVI